MTRKKKIDLQAVVETLPDTIAASNGDITEIEHPVATENKQGPEYALKFEQCEKYFPKLEYRIQRIIRLYFNKVSDEEAARLLQVTADKIQGLYQRYLKLILTLWESQA